MKEEMAHFIENYDLKDVKFFSTKKGGRSDYFLNSAWQMKPFYEKNALDGNGKLAVPKQRAFNKVAHALHDLHPVFESFAYNDVNKTICREIL